jgi:hypothetical protein
VISSSFARDDAGSEHRFDAHTLLPVTQAEERFSQVVLLGAGTALRNSSIFQLVHIVSVQALTRERSDCPVYRTDLPLFSNATIRGCCIFHSPTANSCAHSSRIQLLDFKRERLSALAPPPPALPVAVAINMNAGAASGTRLLAALAAAGDCCALSFDQSSILWLFRF